MLSPLSKGITLIADVRGRDEFRGLKWQVSGSNPTAVRRRSSASG
jgi:hypothetical protein